MKTLEELYAEIKDLNNEQKEKLLEEKANGLVPFLNELTQKNMNGYTLLYSFILGAVLADGQLSFKEATMFSPFFKNFFHGKVDMDEMKEVIFANNANENDLSEYLRSMLSILGDVDYTAKEDILSICLIILSSDELKEVEKDWLRKLY